MNDMLATIDLSEWLALKSENQRLEMENVKLATALRGLYEDNVDYLRLNNLGGADNHWLVVARMALGLPPPVDNDHVADGCERFTSKTTVKP